MLLALAQRFWRETELRLLWPFVYRFGWQSMAAVRAFQHRRAQGQAFPAFLFLSITRRCNLRCRGCWVHGHRPDVDLPLESMDRIISECKQHGSRFFGILGGEPLLHPDLFRLLERHRDCYFQVFTNGTMLNAEKTATMRRLGNVTPLVSVEGLATVSDERRGGKNVYARALDALQHCRRARLITGVATSICQSNINELVTEDFLDALIEQGVLYVWYYIYRPVGADPAPELALSQEQVLRLRRFLVDMRCRKPIVIVDAYWDADGRALCPAAVGISHHINAAGQVEPCPPIQFATDRLTADTPVMETIGRSPFLAHFRTCAAQTTRGCILLEDPATLHRLVTQHNAAATSGRDGLTELAAMTPQPSHHHPGEEIPERHWLYRFAKRHWFFGFGAYG